VPLPPKLPKGPDKSKYSASKKEPPRPAKVGDHLVSVVCSNERCPEHREPRWVKDTYVARWRCNYQPRNKQGEPIGSPCRCPPLRGRTAVITKTSIITDTGEEQ